MKKTLEPQLYTISRDEMVAAFTEWERQWREDPEGFLNFVDTHDLLIGEYGDLTANAFLLMLGQVQGTIEQED
jgi:hypothetical protein